MFHVYLAARSRLRGGGIFPLDTEGSGCAPRTDVRGRPTAEGQVWASRSQVQQISGVRGKRNLSGPSMCEALSQGLLFLVYR